MRRSANKCFTKSKVIANAQRRLAPLLLLLLVAGCNAGGGGGGVIPDFAARPYEPFNREDTIAIAQREWRLFGSVVDDEESFQPQDHKPERAPGLWERIGEYWWLGLGTDKTEARWTGKHDAAGHVFPAADDERYAWSAAFISYVMRIAGAGNRFPYSPNHASYVNAAASGRSPILTARDAAAYMPKPGDLLCHGREWASGLRFADLPTRDVWPGHCAMVVAAQPGVFAVIGGNVYDEVAMTHVTLGSDGSLASSEGLHGYRTTWPIVLEVHYDAETEPDRDR
jgi:hypothetical protein